MNLWINEQTTEQTRMKEWIYEWMNKQEWMNLWMNKQTRMKEQIYEQMYKQK